MPRSATSAVVVAAWSGSGVQCLADNSACSTTQACCTFPRERRQLWLHPFDQSGLQLERGLLQITTARAAIAIETRVTFRAMPRYEFAEGGSNKFWEITLTGKSFTTTYGKIGTDGQTTIKSFGSDAEAKKEADKITAEKMKKGYALAAGTARRRR